MAIVRFGSAHWQGNIKEGKGHVSTESGALQKQPYGFNTRFEDGKGTNPEELLGAAHAACFAMALSKTFTDNDLVADSIDVDAKVSLEQDGGGFTITRVALSLVAKVPGLEENRFQGLAEETKGACPVSKLFDTEITLSAKLLS